MCINIHFNHIIVSLNPLHINYPFFILYIYYNKNFKKNKAAVSQL